MKIFFEMCQVHSYNISNINVNCKWAFNNKNLIAPLKLHEYFNLVQISARHIANIRLSMFEFIAFKWYDSYFCDRSLILIIKNHLFNFIWIYQQKMRVFLSRSYVFVVLKWFLFIIWIIQLLNDTVILRQLQLYCLSKFKEQPFFFGD